MQIYPIFTVPKTDMESGSGDPWTPDGWVGYVAQAGELIQWAADYIIGPHSIKINNRDGGQATGMQTDQFVTEVGKTYRLKFWAKWTGEEAGAMKYLVKNGNGSTNMNGQLFSLSTGAFVNWKMVTRDFLCTIAGSSGRLRFRGNASPTTWLIDQVSLIELTSDSYYTPDPTEQLTVGSDFFKSSRGGDVWHHSIDDSPRDVTWAILNKNIQAIAWDILNENNPSIAWDILNVSARAIAWDILNATEQPFSWSVFAKTLYYIQRFIVNAICFDYKIKEPIQFSKQIMEPLEWTFYPTGTVVETSYLQGDVFDTINVSSPVQFNFQIKEPITFTFKVATVLQGESIEYPG
jgi:hypothetical protein